MTSKEKKTVIFTFCIFYLLLIVFSIVLVIKGIVGGLIFTMFPSLFLIPIFLTFYLVPKETNHHRFLYFLTFVIRYTLVFSAILFPALIWNSFPAVKEQVNSLFLLFPALEILFVYAIIILLFIRLGKDEDKKREEKKK